MASAITIGVIVLLAALLCGVVIWQEHRARLYGRPRTAADILARLQRADQQAAAAYEATRRAMNEAVGQSWRNLTD